MKRYQLILLCVGIFLFVPVIFGNLQHGSSNYQPTPVPSEQVTIPTTPSEIPTATTPAEQAGINARKGVEQLKETGSQFLKGFKEAPQR